VLLRWFIGQSYGQTGNALTRNSRAEVTRVGEGIQCSFNEDAGVVFWTNKSNVQGTQQVTLVAWWVFKKNTQTTNILVEGEPYRLVQEQMRIIDDFIKAKSASGEQLFSQQGIAAKQTYHKMYGESSTQVRQ